MRCLEYAVAAVLAPLAVGLATPRHRETVRDYRRTHPCPATQKTTGACPGWRVDHLIPLCAGGADDPKNMIWQPYAESLEKDRIEVALCRYIERERKRKP